MGLATASAALLLAKSALFGIRVLVLMLVAVYAPSTELASASFALSVTEIGRWIADFGTDTWSVRAISLAASSIEEGRVVSVAITIKALGSALVAPVILIVCGLRLPSEGWRLGVVAAVMLLTSQVIGLAISYFQAKREVWKLRRMVLPCIATAAGACLCVFLTHRVLASLVVMAGGEIYVAGALFALVSGNGARFEMQGVRQDLRSVTVTCLPVAALGIVVGLYTRVDTLVLAAYSFPALAAYTIAQRLFQPFQIAATSFGAVIYTHAAIASSQQLRYARKFLLKELPPVIGISAVLAGGLYFGGSFLIAHAFPQYLAARGPLTVLCVLLPVLAYNSAVCGLVLGFGWFWSVFWVAALDLLLTYLVMIHLVPLHQAQGTVESLMFGAFFNGAALSATMALAIRKSTRHLK